MLFPDEIKLDLVPFHLSSDEAEMRSCKSEFLASRIYNNTNILLLNIYITIVIIIIILININTNIL